MSADYKQDPVWIEQNEKLQAAFVKLSEEMGNATTVGEIVSATMLMRDREKIALLNLQEAIDYVTQAVRYAISEAFGGDELDALLEAKAQLNNLELACRVRATKELSL